MQKTAAGRWILIILDLTECFFFFFFVDELITDWIMKLSSNDVDRNEFRDKNVEIRKRSGIHKDCKLSSRAAAIVNKRKWLVRKRSSLDTQASGRPWLCTAVDRQS